MLGSTANGRLMGPGVGSSTSSSSSSSLSSSSSSSALQQQQSHTTQQQHQLAHHPYTGLPSHHHYPLQPQHPALAAAHHHRSIWPSLGAATGRSAFELQTATNGEVTESLFAAGGYNTPPASSPFLPCSPLELVAKNFHSAGAALSFSQANSSIFVQSQTDFINGTTAVAKKTETCIGRWEHGTIEPLQIQVPPNSFLPTATTGSFALNSPESASSGEPLLAGGHQTVGDRLHPAYYRYPYKPDENGNHHDTSFLRSYCIEREYHHERLLTSVGVEPCCKPKLHLPLADDPVKSRRDHSAQSSFDRYDSTALLSPTSPTTPPSYEYCKLKRKLHSILLEPSTENGGRPVSNGTDDRSSSGLLQTSHTPRQPASGPEQRHLEATPAPELANAQQPATVDRKQQCGVAATFNHPPTASSAPASEAVNHRPRRRWAALHSAHHAQQTNGDGNGSGPTPSAPPSDPRPAAEPCDAPSGGSCRPKSPGHQQSATLRAVERLPKKRRSIRVDRQEESANRDTDSKTVVHIKREPCQVSEVTTSNSYEATTNTTALNAIIKIEASSPKGLTGPGTTGTAGNSSRTTSNFTSSSVARSNLLTASHSASAIISNVTVGGSSSSSGGGGGGGTNIGTSGGGGANASSSTVAATMEQLGLASATNNHPPGPTTASATPSAAQSIPVGIAVARQRLQESSATPSSQLHPGKELNRYGLGLASAAANGASLNGTTADLGCATPGLSQNMFFTGTNSTMIPLAPDAVAMGVTNAAVQNAVRTPPALWQYPAPVPMESMLPMPPIPPVGFQLVRDPTTGQILFLPAAATIEPFQQAVVWPSYPQSTASLQSQHLLLPQLPPQQLQPPPLAPLQMLSSDYLSTASTTLHQQHTQTHHSTRYLALTSESNGKRSSLASGKQSQSTANSSSSGPASTCGQPTIPLPIPASHAFIKIEDCSTSAGISAAMGASTGSTHLATSLFGSLSDVDKANGSGSASGTNSLTNGAGPHSHLALPAPSDLTPQLLFQPANLIHIAPHHPGKSHSSGHTLLEASSATGTLSTSVANPTPPPSALPTTVTSALLSGLSGQSTNPNSHPPPLVASTVPATTCLTPPPDTTTTLHSQTDDTDGTQEVIEPPEVQDANIQTDTPIMSEDETTQPPGGTDAEATLTEAAAIISTEATLASAYHALASEQPLCHSTLINSSGDSAIEPDMSTSALLNATSTSNCDQVDMELEPTNKSAPPPPLAPIQNEPENLSVAAAATPSIVGGQQRRVPKLELHSPTGPNTTTSGISTFAGARTEKDTAAPISQQDHPVDLSGLELLSHSIEVFQKKSSLIKKEPISPQLPTDPSSVNVVPSLPTTSAAVCPEPAGPCQLTPPMVPPTVPEAFLRTDEPMGGLNLLCALAEQRFQEEGMFNKDSPATSSSSGSSNSSGSSYSSNTSASSASSTASPPASPPNSCGKAITQQELLSAASASHGNLATLIASGANGAESISRKRKHHKHSKDSNGKKSSKKSKHDKEHRRAEKRRKQSSDGTSPDGEGDLDAEIKESLTRVKAKLNRCNCKDGDEKDHRCCRTQWPTANELFSVIESDMKERLERITRQCEEKKRELEQMSTAAVAKVKPLANNSMVRIPEMGKTFFGGFGTVTTAGGMLNTFGSGSGGSSVLGHGLGGPKFSTIPALSPNFSSSSNSTTFVELPKLSSDTDSSGKREDDDACSIERLSYSKRKGGIPKKHDELTLTETIVAKKPKSLVGYILASKNTRDSSVKDAVHQKAEKQHHNHWSHVLHQSGANGAPVGGLGLAKQHHISESKFKKSPIHSSKFESTTSDDTSNLSDSSLKPQVKIRSPAGGVFAFEDENSKPSDAAFSIFGGKPSIFDKVKTNATVGHQVGSLIGLKVSPVKAAVVTPLMKPQHHMVGNGTPTNGNLIGGPVLKRKKSRSKDRKRRSSEKKRIDQRCLLTSEHLGRDKTRVLTAMGGLFYAGCLSAVQPPDIYAVTLDGERGNRPHIMSREEVLRDAILEVAPKSVDDIIPGTRLCAYWSQQYRCLYPGVAAEPASPDPEKRFVNVEFDDGDNGKIALEDIRFLMSDYPIVEYDPNPLLSLGKRKRQPSHSEPCPQIGTLGPASMVPHGVPSQPVATHPQPVTTTPLTATVTPMISSPLAGASTINSFALTTERAEKRLHDEAYREERRRLKKIRKDKLRRLAANNAELAANGAGGTGVHKHKKSKSKCYDEFCKHRKHKKRRKHKKHHRETVAPSSPEGTAADATGSMDDDISQGDSASQTAGQFSPRPVQQEGPTFGPTAEKEDNLTEEEVSSSVTESSGSYYQPQKKPSTAERKPSTDQQNGSKIAAFLPARQLWAWCGKGYRRSAGRVKKQFYKSIQRGKETISVGDSAVFLSTGRPDRPYIGHIESMWETSTNNMVVRVKWFYHPEETQDCPNLKYPGALFQSPHEDENDVQTISHKCEVLELRDYTAKFGADPKQYTSIYDNNDTYYLAGYYDPTVMTIKMQPEIEILPPNERWVTTTSTTVLTPTTPSMGTVTATTKSTPTSSGVTAKSLTSTSSNGNTKASNNVAHSVVSSA
ncbi:protein winged eye isoform X3 [Anopheles stephensi]|uniref:protein winged eye isoform X3 n=1 Tax=Anopheles stephensi TaxID=30069 RepID=UPI001658BF6B|nr:protein winged eye isoform X3 [Anopheles stephensi]